MRYALRVTKRQVRKLPLLLRMLGTNHVQDAIRRPNGLPLWQLLYCVSGSGEIRFADRRSVVRPGQMAMLPPFEQHSYQKLDEEWVVHYLGFNGTACLSLISGMGLGQSGVLSLAHPEQFLAHVREMEAILTGQLQGKNLRCSKELYSTLVDLSLDVTRLPMMELSESSGLSREVMLYLEDHYAEEITLDQLSAHFHLTPEYLCARFKEETQQTIMKYLKGIRIHQAKIKLMEMPDANLTEIGRLCGFHSLSYFGKVFREATGYTPHTYRLGVR